MVVGEGFFVALRLTLRVKPSRSKLLILPHGEHADECKKLNRGSKSEMVVGEGFEPSKSMTADLQSDPFGHSGTPPLGKRITEVKLPKSKLFIFPRGEYENRYSEC